MLRPILARCSHRASPCPSFLAFVAASSPRHLPPALCRGAACCAPSWQGVHTGRRRARLSWPLWRRVHLAIFLLPFVGAQHAAPHLGRVFTPGIAVPVFLGLCSGEFISPSSPLATPCRGTTCRAQRESPSATRRLPCHPEPSEGSACSSLPSLTTKN